MTTWSPYAGRPRTALRRTIAAVLAADLVLLSLSLARAVPMPFSRHNAPAWLLAIGGHVDRIAVIAGVGFVGAAMVFLGRYVIVGGALALAALWTLVESQAALMGGPQRIFFFGGGTMLGWIAGLALARARHGRAASTDASNVEDRYAEAGALGMLAAAYLNAVVSKFRISGLHWADMHSLRTVVLGHHHFGDTSILGRYADWTVRSAWIPTAFAAATLAIQLTAPAMLVSRRARRTWAVLILAFHANVWALAHILFAQAMVLLVAFAGFWPWWLRQSERDVRDDPPLPDVAPGPRRRANVTFSVVGVALIGVAWLSPFRRYTTTHHGGTTSTGGHAAAQPTARPPVPAPPRAELVQLLGGLTPGAVVRDWRLAGFARSDEADHVPEIEFVRGPDTVRVQLVARGARTWPPPAHTDHYDLFTRRPGVAQGAADPSNLAPLLTELSDIVRSHESAVLTLPAAPRGP